MQPIYPLLYSMLAEFLFGSALELTPHMELVLTEIASFGCIFVVAVPFLVCWLIIKLMLGVFN